MERMNPKRTKPSPHTGDKPKLAPAIDISPLCDEPWSECTSLLQDLTVSLARHGAVRLTGLGLSTCKAFSTHALSARQSKEFFDLPLMRKASAAAIQCPGNGLSHGYRQVESDTQNTMVAETFVVGPPYDTQRPTRWPTGILGEVLKMTLHAVLRQCLRLHHDLLYILEVVLDLRHDELAEQWVHQKGEVRIGYNTHPGQIQYARNGEGKLMTLVFSETTSEEIVLLCGPKLQEWTTARLGVIGSDDEYAVGLLLSEDYCYLPSPSSYSPSFVSFADGHASGNGA